jgi:hypothetical protein
MWEQLRKVRGWSSPFAVLPPELVPVEMRPRRSFHDTMRLSPLLPFPTFAKYASEGGLVFEDEEAKPVQRPLEIALGNQGHGGAPAGRAAVGAPGGL